MWEDLCALEGNIREKTAYIGSFDSGNSVCVGGKSVCQQDARPQLQTLTDMFLAQPENILLAMEQGTLLRFGMDGGVQGNDPFHLTRNPTCATELPLSPSRL